jgi:glycosyltransferase involved in cell wall biosynthesis
MIGPLPPEDGGVTAGGVATHTAELVLALSTLGIDVTVLATNVPRVPRGCRLGSVTAHYRATGWLPLLRRGLDSVDGAWALGRLGFRLAQSPRAPRGWRAGRRALLGEMLDYRRFLLATRPDVVHVQHPLERHLTVRLLSEMDGLNLPVVVTFHSFFREHADEVIFGLMQPNLAFGDRFIAVNPHVGDEAVRLGADPTRMRVIRSGVDTSRYRPEPPAIARRALGLKEEGHWLLYVGNLEPRKGVDRLLRILARVREQLADVRLAVVGVAVGSGAEDPEPGLRAMSSDLGLAEAVRFTGRVSGTDLVHWYNAADLFVLASDSEAQGIVALEAMSCGRVVIASAVGGLRETITDGVDGFLLPPTDEPAWHDRIVQVLSNADAARRMGEAARRKVEAHWSWRQTAEATAAVYHELLSSVPGHER